MKKDVILKHTISLAAYLVIVWGFYRLLFKLPDNIEELFVKPVIWLIPVFYILNKEKRNLESVGITLKNLFPSIYISLVLGALFAIEALVINLIKYKGQFNFSANIGGDYIVGSLLISFATAFSEEIAFRGYLFNRVWEVTKNEMLANFSTSIVWTIIHAPVAIFVWKLSFEAAALYLGLTAIFGIGSAFVFARTKNIASSVLLHVLWEWPIVLFR